MYAAIARQRRGEHVSATTNERAAVEAPSEAVFSMRSVPRLYSGDEQENSVSQTVVGSGLKAPRAVRQ
jgi:hypothetical protein